MRIENKNLGFTIIEVMIAIFIFAMGMASIFMVISSSINVNSLNKNIIIASNLASEQIEIVRNIRDNNYANFRKWNYIPNSMNDYSNILEAGKYYEVENDYTSTDFPFIIKTDGNQSFSSDYKQDLKDGKYDDYKLCIKKDTDIYSYNCTSDDKQIKFYKYLYIEKLKDESGNIIRDALKLTSKVIWYDKGYHQFDIKTILANFNRY